MVRFKPMTTSFVLAFVLTACAEIAAAPVKYADGVMTGDGFNNAWHIIKR